MKFFNSIVVGIQAAFAEIKQHFQAAVSWTAEELKSATAEYLATVKAEEVSLGQAFEAGANWAVSRATDVVQAAVATSAGEGPSTGDPVDDPVLPVSHDEPAETPATDSQPTPVDPAPDAMQPVITQ